jgi:hypothetical protein
MALALPEAHATTYAKIMDLDELTSSATAVVAGTVDTAWSFERDGLIWTRVGLDIEESLLGTTSRHVSLEIIGGTVDGVSLSVPGAPHFEVGADVLVFLDGDQLVGFGQGAFALGEGIASRGLGPLLPEGPSDFSVKERLPSLDQSSDCLQPKVWADYAEGWTLRGVSHTLAKNGEIVVDSLQLMPGLEYRFQICGDQHLGGIETYVIDAGGDVVDQFGITGREGLLNFVARDDEYSLVIRARDLPPTVVGTSLSVSVAYR